MKKLLLTLTILPFVLCACSKPADTASDAGTTGTATGGSKPKPAAKPEDQVVGTWKIDVANTTVPATTEKDKAEEAAVRIEAKADGTYSATGSGKPDNGKWVLKNHTVTFTPDTAGGTTHTVTLADDGSKMTETTPGDKPMMIVFIKA